MFCRGSFSSRTLTHYFHIVFGVSAAEHLILLSYCFVFGVSAAKHTLLSYCFAFGVSATEHLHITSILLCVWCFSNRTLTHYFHIALHLVFQQQNTYTLLSYCFVFGVSAYCFVFGVSAYCFVFGVSAYCFVFGVSATKH